jgi:hypothetical protein
MNGKEVWVFRAKDHPWKKKEQMRETNGQKKKGVDLVSWFELSKTISPEARHESFEDTQPRPQRS